jgi:hypothetical protein
MDVKTRSDTAPPLPTRRRMPLAASVVASVCATAFVAVTALVASASGCGFAGGRCESGSTSASGPLIVALLAAATAWAATAWVAQARVRTTSIGLLYAVGCGGPLAAAALGVGVLVASAS